MNRPLILTSLAAVMFAATFTVTAAPASARPNAKTHAARTAHTSLAPVDSRNPVLTAAAIAEGFWGAIPCAGQIKIVANRPLVHGLDPSTDGWVTFDSSLGADDLSAPAATYTACTISMAHWNWPSWTAMERDWGMFCLTVVHEMGHLLGHPHSLTPRSVMAPDFTSDANVPSVCNRTWLAGWRQASAKG